MTHRFLSAAAVFILLTGVTTAANAAACRDAKGKFIKCAPTAPAPGTRCKDAKGKFAKCGAPGAKPVAK